MPRRRSTLIYSDPVAEGAVADQKALDITFNGTDEWLRSSDSGLLSFDIANAWTIGMWLKADSWPPTTANSRYIFDLIDTTNNSNRIYFTTSQFDHTDAGFDIRLTDINGSIIKHYAYHNTQPSLNAWHLYNITWDGTNLRFYIDANEQTVSPSDPQHTDNSGSMTNEDRLIWIFGRGVTSEAGRFDGRGHSTGLWNTPLPQASIEGLYSGLEFDWQFNRRRYRHAANLVHYWRHGFNASSIGEDSVGSIDLTGINVTAADIVVDFPGF